MFQKHFRNEQEALKEYRYVDRHNPVSSNFMIALVGNLNVNDYKTNTEAMRTFTKPAE